MYSANLDLFFGGLLQKSETRDLLKFQGLITSSVGSVGSVVPFHPYWEGMHLFSHILGMFFAQLPSSASFF
jgi:hypothetical protein